MDKKEKLKILTQEREYYDVEYLEKHKSNKLEFRDIIFHDFINELKDFDINNQENKMTFVGANEIITIVQTTDFEKYPKNPLFFSVTVKLKDIDKTFQFRPFNDSPLPNPDFNRLLTNPYKGKDLLDIEIEEQQKNIDFIKGFITDKVDYKQYIYGGQFGSDESMMEFKTIKELIKYIRME